ncbi:hypothetical protein CDL12_25235 [Handroanthus impetiginosus]|uniref:Homeobox domain-containing protein n=1 Tax=Handroanthus impetiginosus TaxID=429701 RepID=A0A2G9GBA5_9LAMI|nr:hypothetical protein CDL12_25235 [Handroanthus impetiginosus]
MVSNWFINARVRLWKPMVEEIHMLETRQNQKPSQTNEQQPPNTLNDHLPTGCSTECENASTSIQKTGDFHLKRSREEANETSRGNEGPIRLPYENLLQNPHQLGIGVSNGGVSLTLGLHQNGVGLSSDSYPMNAARRFGLDSHGEGYVVSGFAAQNRQFGRDHVMDGQLMHDFVG